MKLKFLFIHLFSFSIVASSLHSMPIWSELRANTPINQNSIFLKDIRLVEMNSKYGEEAGRGLIVFESVFKGEKLWPRLMTDKTSFTREELLNLKAERPDLALALDSFSCQSGEDLFSVPTSCFDGTKIDDRQFINHSCNPNCGYYIDENGDTFTIAIKDIKAGEELTYHYGMLETEMSLTYGLECKCGSANCSNKWTFDLYRRNDSFAKELMGYAKPELQAKVERMKTSFWHSDKCYLKHDALSQSLILNAKEPVNKGDVVASFIDNNWKHVEYSDDYNCEVWGKNVIAIKEIEAGTNILVPLPINVYCDGVFDLFHLGHQRHIRNCRNLGDRLFVGIVNDETVQSYKRKSIMDEDERLNVVSKFEGVYQVIPDAPMFIDEEFLAKWNIHIVCISPEYDHENDPYYVVPRQKGMIRVMSRLDGVSTTELIHRIQARN